MRESCTDLPAGTILAAASWPGVLGAKRRADCSCYLGAESPFDARARKDIGHEGAIGINSDRRRLVGSNRGQATTDTDIR
jgi:hypothetical protein